MASLSNINGIFDVHSTGAILFSTSHGTSGQILKSNGNAAPTWVDASTVIGGPYLPLTGGTLTGATATASGISFTVGGALRAGELGIGRNPNYPLDVYNSSSTSGTSTGTTMQMLWNYVGGDISQQKTFIDFVFQDDNDNEYPQVRIGAEVGQNGDAGTTVLEGCGAFVVYTNNATGSTPGANSLTERMRVDYAGNVGINDSSPSYKLSVDGNANFTGLVSGITPTANANFATKGYVDSVTPGAGPFLPLTGGTLTGGLTGTTATFSASVTASGNSNSFGTTTFESDAGLNVFTTTAGVGAEITFSDEPSSQSQKGFVTYFHQDTKSYGSGSAFVISGDQSTMTVLADGKLMYNEGVYLKPATGTGAGTRKDGFWDAAYNDKITALSVTGTTTKTLTATQQDGGQLSTTWTDNDSGGTVKGTGTATRVAFWSAADTISSNADLYWDNTNNRLGVGLTSPSAPLHVVSSTDLGDALVLEFNGTYQGGPYQTFQYNEGGSAPSEDGDLLGGIRSRTAYNTSSGYAGYSTAIEFRNDGAPTSTSSPGRIEFKTTDIGNVNLETRLTIKNRGYVGIGTTSPDTLLHIYNSSTAWGAYSTITLGTDTKGLNQAQLKYYRGASTSTESFQLSVRGTTALTALYNGRVGIGETSPADKLDVNGAILCNNRVQIDGVDDVGNVTGSVDSLRATGYGLMGNRPGNIYITNGNSAAGAQIVFGLQGAHNGNNKLVIGNTISYFNNNKLLVNKTVDHGGQLQVATTDTTGSIRIGGGNGAGQSRVFIESNGNSSYIDSFGDGTYMDLAIQAAVLKLQTHSGASSRSVDMGTQVWRSQGSNPISKLNIEVNDSDAICIYNTAENDAYLRFVDSQSNGSQYSYISWSSGTGNPMVINNMGANAFYISGDGYGGVGMGGSPSTGVAGDRLKITGANNGLGCIKAISGQYSYGIRIEGSNLSTQLALYTSSTSQTTQINFEVAGNSSAGKITTTTNTTTYTTSSDYRLKENIIPISDSIYRLNQLKPSRFNFIQEPGKTVDGFIAHEVQEIVPEAIVGEKDEVDENGGIIPQSIDQAKLVPLLVAAIQELEARVKELENK